MMMCLGERNIDAFAATEVAYGHGGVDPSAAPAAATDEDGGGSWIVAANQPVRQIDFTRPFNIPGSSLVIAIVTIS